MSGPLGSAQWMYASETGYQIEDSLRFEDGSSAYLSRTPAAAGNLTTWTLSMWVKRGNLINGTLFSAGFLNQIIFETDRIYFEHVGAGNYLFLTTNKLRDTSAWYHLVFVWDTSNATSTDRMRIYINNERPTDFDYSTSYPVQNESSVFNSATTHEIGHRINPALYYLDGYLSDINFIDGQALDPTSFGETIDGYWRPIPYAGTYGTNGFHLDFNGNTNDTSGNGNNWTANNISAHDYVPDSPTNNFCTLNPLFTNGGSTQNFKEGNLQFTADGNYALANGTFAMRTGKWYWETYIKSWVSVPVVGITRGTNAANNSYVGYDPNGNVKGFGYSSGGIIYGASGIGTSAGSQLASGQTTYTTGDVIGCSFDADVGELKFYKNGTLIYTLSSIDEFDWMPATSAYNGGINIVNFGQDSTFSGATTAGGNTDANGVGDFKHPVPSGFLALATSNLPSPTIIDGSEHFNTVLWTGDGASSRSLTGVGFEPSLVWSKDRNSGYQHSLQDVVRGTGAGGKLYSSLTEAEGGANSVYGHITSFDSDGFSVATGTGGAQHVNQNTVTYAAWNWKAGGTAVSNTDGSITSQVSANTDMGFSIVSYTGTGNSSDTVGTGLSSSKPLAMAIVKRRDSTSEWQVGNIGYQGSNFAYHFELNSTAAVSGSVPYFMGSQNPSSGNLLYLISGALTSGATYIAYCFQNSDIVKAGSFTGNGSADGPFVYTGFRPAFVMMKNANILSNWTIYDTSRDTYNASGLWLGPNSSSAESDDRPILDFLSNGFKIRNTYVTINGSGNTLIYLAFASTPFKFSPAR
jgi:hypothetical protein